jgi:hypothetical protein
MAGSSSAAAALEVEELGAEAYRGWATARETISEVRVD